MRRLRRCKSDAEVKRFMDLNELREGIDAIDNEILSLFLKRMELCRSVADYKKEHSLPVFQGGREQQIIDRIKEKTADASLEDGTANLFTTIMDISKLLQNRKLLADAPDFSFSAPHFDTAERIGCQGMAGANSETAAATLFGEKPVTFLRTFEDVVSAVADGTLEYGILPVRNSTAGTVAAVYDLLSEYPVNIAGAVTVDIDHCLAARTDMPLSEISCVYSHPQALAQCGGFLRKNCLRTADSLNTAAAAEMVSESGDDEKLAAVCSARCAERYGLKILSRDIADCPVNRTGFICISRSLEVAPDADTVAVMLKIPHKLGSLSRLLTKFSVNGMNLTRIENRPVRDGSFDVMFCLEFDGKITDSSVKTLLCGLSSDLEYFRLLGNYRNFT